MADEQELNDSVVQPDAPGDVGELESMIAADEAADAARDARRQPASDDGQARDRRGRFKDASANNGAQRAGERLTPEEVSARQAREAREQGRSAAGQDGKSTQDGAAAGKAGQQPAGQQSRQAQQGKAQNQAQDGQTQAQEQGQQGQAGAADDGRSKYRKEIERRDQSWQALNKEKETLSHEREQFKLEREQFDAQLKTAVSVRRDDKGRSAADYESYSKRFEEMSRASASSAMQAEQLGDYARAEQLQGEAQRYANLAKAAGQTAGGLRSDGPAATWAKLGKDVPEALTIGSEFNQEIRAALRGNPELLGDPVGPYRAAVQVGAKVLKTVQGQLATAQADAAKVPALQKQVEELSARVKELEGLTSPGDGGGGAVHRGRGVEDDFASLSSEQMGQRLDRELANVL